MDRKKTSNCKMESWLLDVKRMKIPRPKFSGKYPLEPPKDYCSDDQCKDDKRTAAALLTARNIVKATEDLRRELQEKL
ncbi:hypothetical protein RUM44_003361 [Polyplax serrata]|uniref:Uncharacterized protein n=1 Tax=Polyplax serrata TaxID=468196 RepID=A0ABR1AG78_POLSC